jgi:translocation and assembly module TamA
MLALVLPCHARAADPVTYDASLAPVANDALMAVLRDSSLLVALQDTAKVGPFGLISRTQQDQGRLVSALNGFGYYKGAVAITIGGKAADDPALPEFLESAAAGQTVPVRIAVSTGPQFHIGQIALNGQVPEAARNAVSPLAEGAPAVASDVLAAQARILSALQDKGFALATVSAPDALVHPDRDTLDVAFTVTPGPRLDLGPITINGLQDVNERFVRRRLLVHQGDRFDPAKIEAARQDLVNTGVFGTVRAAPAAKADAAGQLPLAFTVQERPRHAVTVTASYSTDLGVMLGAKWQHRNLFGNAEQLTVSASSSGGGTAQPNPGYNVSAQFVRPDLFRRDLSLQVDATLLKESLQAYDRTAALADILFAQKLSKQWTVGAGIAFTQEQVTQEGVTRDYTLVGLPLTARYDSTDNLFNPGHGIRANASVTPTESLSHRDATFVLLQAGASTYLDLSALWGEQGRSIIALRALAGAAEGATQFALPPDQRFYAGGSATVRGYRYQAVGPRFADRNPMGGTSVAAASVEFRQRILESFGAVAFLDAGQVAANGTAFSGSMMLGAGVGVRYYTDFGPIRVDFALPLDKRPGDDSFEVYIGIGQAF